MARDGCIMSPVFEMSLGKAHNPCRVQMIIRPKGWPLTDALATGHMSTYLHFCNDVNIPIKWSFAFVPASAPSIVHDGSLTLRMPPDVPLFEYAGRTYKANETIGVGRTMLLSFLNDNQQRYIKGEDGKLSIMCIMEFNYEGGPADCPDLSTEENVVQTLNSELSSMNTISDELRAVFATNSININEQPFGHLSDVTIVCKDDDSAYEAATFKCHKVFLSLRSSVFSTYFLNDSLEKKENRVVITDLSAQTVEAMLNFIYTDQVKTEQITPELLRAADKYDLQRLKTICEKDLVQKMDLNNVVQFWMVAHLHQAKHLEGVAVKVIVRNWRTIKEDGEFKEIVTQYPTLYENIISYVLPSA